MRWFKKLEGSQPMQKSRDELHDYWRNPDEANNPVTYLPGNERSEFLLSLIKRYVGRDASIIELGCNIGRNLNHLWQAGYNNLSGIEINEQAIKLMRDHFPDMPASIHHGSIEDRIKELGQYDLVFTMAVLEHIHEDSEWVFSEIFRIARRHLVVIEDEKQISERHFPRNYKKIFEPLGFRQVYEHNCSDVPMFTTKFYARVFQKG